MLLSAIQFQRDLLWVFDRIPILIPVEGWGLEILFNPVMPITIALQRLRLGSKHRLADRVAVMISIFKEQSSIPRIYIYSGGPSVNLFTVPGGLAQTVTTNFKQQLCLL